MKRSVTSKAPRPRTAWFIIPVKIGGTYELLMGWKSYDTSISFYSDPVFKTNPVKPPWGRLVSCDWNQLNKNGELKDCYKFKNETGKKINFEIALFNALVLGVNDFTQKVIAMRAGHQDKLLAKIFSALPCAEGFSQHNPEIHTSLGLVKDESWGPVLCSEEMETLDQCVQFAKAAALDVEKKEDALGKIGAGGKKTKKSGGGEGEPTVKMSRVDRMDDDKMKELEDDKGVEKSFVSKYFGRADVKLENLSLSDKISIPIIEIKVLAIANSMQKQFDPALVNFTVYPADPDNFDASHLEKNSYKIIHGIHRFKALQRLEKRGVLETLPYMKDKVVTCFLVNVKSEADVVYGNLRGNDIASKFQRQPYIHELVFIYDSFKETNNSNPSKALDLIVRFAKLLLAHPDEITALRKIAAWSKECFDSLVSVLKRYIMPRIKM